LEDQLLAEVVRNERIDLEQIRINLIKQVFLFTTDIARFSATKEFRTNNIALDN
jgi:hypothetical protein